MYLMKKPYPFITHTDLWGALCVDLMQEMSASKRLKRLRGKKAVPRSDNSSPHINESEHVSVGWDRSGIGWVSIPILVVHIVDSLMSATDEQSTAFSELPFRLVFQNFVALE